MSEIDRHTANLAQLGPTELAAALVSAQAEITRLRAEIEQSKGEDMDHAVFDKHERILEGPYDDADGGEIRAERAAETYTADVGAWAGPVCASHPSVPRESCPGYPHE